MRTHALLFLAAVTLSLGCVKRVAPSAGGSQTGLSGVPLSFGKAQELPPGVSLRWDFGDGQTAEGAQATHVFPHAGAFTVTQLARASDGSEERATTQITVLRRSVPSAVPADARAALVLERPWQKAALHKELAERVGLGEVYADYVRGIHDGLGFDFVDTTQAEANGFDTDEGVALYTVPQDAEALVATVGISDAPKAIARLKGLLTRAGDNGFVLEDKKLSDGTPVVVGTRSKGAEKVAFLERYGYLYLRTPGQSDPLAALASASVLGPDAGLTREKTWAEAIARVGLGDAVFWSSAPSGKEGGTNDGLRPGGRFAGELGASAFSIGSEPDFIRFTVFGQLRALQGKSLTDAFTPGAAPADLAQQLPAGAALFLKVSGSAPLLWRQLVRAAGVDEVLLAARLKEWLGMDFEKEVLPTVSGNGVIGVYLDASSLLEALLGEQVAAWDRSTFLLAGQVLPGHDKVLRAALDSAAKTQGGSHAVGSATFWHLTEGLQVALRDQVLFLAVGGAAEATQEGKSLQGLGANKNPKTQPATPAKSAPATKASKSGKLKALPVVSSLSTPPWEATAANLGPLARILLAPPGSPHLSEALKTAEVPFLTEAGHQIVWIDIATALHAIERAAEAQGGALSAAIRLLTGRAHGLRDVVIDAVPSADGVTAQIKLRLQPRAGAPHSAPASATKKDQR